MRTIKRFDDEVNTVRQFSAPYDSVENEVFTSNQIALADALSPYIISASLTVDILNTLLPLYYTNIQEQTTEKNLGKNSQINLLSLLTQLAGIAGTMASAAQSNHLPPSVLNKSSVSNSLDKHKKNIGKIKKLKQFSKTAVIPGNMDIPNISTAVSSLSSLLSGSTSNTPKNIVNTIKSKIS